MTVYGKEQEPRRQWGSGLKIIKESDHFPSFLTQEAPSKLLGTVTGPQYKRNLGQAKRNQQRATGMARWHEHSVQGRAEAEGWAWDLHQLQGIRDWPTTPFIRRHLSSLTPKLPLDRLLDSTGELPKKRISVIWFCSPCLSWQTLTESLSPRSESCV